MQLTALVHRAKIIIDEHAPSVLAMLVMSRSVPSLLLATSLRLRRNDPSLVTLLWSWLVSALNVLGLNNDFLILMPLLLASSLVRPPLLLRMSS